MSGKFMKVKKMAIPMMVLLTIAAQASPAFAMSGADAVSLMRNYDTVVMEVVDVEDTQTVLAGNRVFEDFKDYNKDLGYGKLNGHWAQSNIKTLYEKGGIAGYPEGDFRANKTISGAELIALILNASNTGDNLVGDSWSDKIMNRAYELGIVTASDIGKADANKAISREKMALILVNSADKLLKEDTTGIKLVDTAVIKDLNSASQSYRDEIRTAYSMGLLAGTGNGQYQPKSSTTRAEATAIVNRLFGYMSRVEVKYDTEVQVPVGQAGKYTALPDKSNVGNKTGYIYPAEGLIGPDGKEITRDPATGVLGYGNGQHGGLYIGVEMANGKEIGVGSAKTRDDYDNMGGRYEQRGDYVYWESEWGKIDEHNIAKLEKEQPNAAYATVADIFGNIIPGGTPYDKDAMYAMDSTGNWVGLKG